MASLTFAPSLTTPTLRSENAPSFAAACVMVACYRESHKDVSKCCMGIHKVFRDPPRTSLPPS